MAKKKKRAIEPALSAEELSAFALQPTFAEGLDASDPFSRNNYKLMKGLLMQRVNASRYLHSISVAKTARKLARAYGYDPDKARMAGLLHDWDKALRGQDLEARVKQFSLPISDEVLNTMPWVLHGPTAAAVLAEEFPMFGEEVFRSIERHTVGAPNMGTLDMIVFVADKIEPSHEVEVYRNLYEKIGVMPLEEMFYEVLKAGIAHLVRVGKPISFETVTVWNWYSSTTSKEKGE